MVTTAKDVAEMVAQHLHYQQEVGGLVDWAWAENQLMTADCESLLSALGFKL